MTPLLLCSWLMQSVFLVEPYLQLGNRPMPDSEGLTVMWHSPDQDAAWRVEARQAGAPWKASAKLAQRRVSLRATAPFRVYQADLEGLAPGAAFDYRVLRDGREVFAAQGKTRGLSDAPVRFVLVGDTGQGTAGERKIAAGMLKADPDAVLFAGDIVYSAGRLSQYVKNFFPYYNSAQTPLLRSRVAMPAVGNHDVDESLDLGAKPDGLAYFHVWNTPLNGPPGVTIPIRGNAADQDAFRRATQGRFPGIANYSFEWGPVHWTVLDSSDHVDWTRDDLRRWLVSDLESAKTPWRFVMFHHPPFHSSRKHAEQQRMRLLADIFEKHQVPVVFAAHVHNYQRTHALKFEPRSRAYGKDQRVPGTFQRASTGVTYIVSGAGGAGLVDGGFTAKPSEWQDFTAVFEARQHSFTLIEANRARVVIRQTAADGRELDRLQLTR